MSKMMTLAQQINEVVKRTSPNRDGQVDAVIVAEACMIVAACYVAVIEDPRSKDWLVKRCLLNFEEAVYLKKKLPR